MGKGKTAAAPSLVGRERLCEVQTHHFDAHGVKTPSYPGVLTSRRTRRFRVGWTPRETSREPLESLMPAIYVIDGEHEVLLRAIMSGVYKTDLDVLVSEDSVYIRGRVRHSDTENSDIQGFQETYSETFSRRVYLPGQVDSGRATAEFDDDVLEMTLPKIAWNG